MEKDNKKETPVKEISKAIVTQKPPIVKKVNTINIGSGTRAIEYAKVSARIAELHKSHKNAAIKTEYDFRDGWVIFKATLVLDAKNEVRVFTGTSLGKANGIKAFEKLETIAVGRALAFAGFLSDGEIASSEEMIKYEESPVVVDEMGVIAKLNGCKTAEELKNAWLALSPEDRANRAVVAAKDRIKEFLPNENSRSGTKKSGLAPAPQGEDNGNRA